MHCPMQARTQFRASVNFTTKAPTMGTFLRICGRVERGVRSMRALEAICTLLGGVRNDGRDAVGQGNQPALRREPTFSNDRGFPINNGNTRGRLNSGGRDKGHDQQSALKSQLQAWRAGLPWDLPLFLFQGVHYEDEDDVLGVVAKNGTSGGGAGKDERRTSGDAWLSPRPGSNQRDEAQPVGSEGQQPTENDGAGESPRHALQYLHDFGSMRMDDNLPAAFRTKLHGSHRQGSVVGSGPPPTPVATLTAAN